MNKTLTKKDNPRFDVINRYNVAILSLRNQLKQANGIDELTAIAGKIIELEQQILVEKSAGYAQLEEEKKKVEGKVDKLRRELKRAEDDLNRIDNSMDLKVNGYRKALQTKIDLLNEEYNDIMSYSSD
jgi:predicted nuclease with TOPRIM domain